MLQVSLCADNDARNRVHAAEVGDLLVDDVDHVEGLARRDGVDKDEAMDADGVLGVEDGVLVLRASSERAGRRGRKRGKADLASGVEDLTVVLDTLVGYVLRERALDGRVVGLDKVVLNVLDNE